MILDAVEVISLDPLKYRCPYCGQVHTSMNDIEDDVGTAECCQVSKAEEAFEGAGTDRLRVRVDGLSATLQQSPA